MAAVTTATHARRQDAIEQRRPGAGHPAGPGGDRGNGYGGGNGGAPPTPFGTAEVGLTAVLAAVSMLFIGFVSAYLVRRGAPDWVQLALPPILWLNTALLLASSVTLELACRAAGGRRWELAGRHVGLTLLLAAGFVGGQLVAWRQLVAAGLYLQTGPHSAFFYLLTGIHGLHVLGGVVALLLASVRLRAAAATARRFLRLAAIYWHFLGLVWLVLFALLRWA